MPPRLSTRTVNFGDYDILGSYNYVYILFMVHDLLRHVSYALYYLRWCKYDGVLEITVGLLKGKGWAESISGTYTTHLRTHLQFCDEYKRQPVQKTIYIAYLVDRNHYAHRSIRSYIYIKSVLHKMNELHDPTSNSLNMKHY